MKKLLTLFIAVIVFTAGHAQTARQESRNVIFGSSRRQSDATPSQNSRDVVFGSSRGSYPQRRYHYHEGRKCYKNDDYRGKKWHKDNGKHLGWYKGKGNPHKHRD
jgi:hypothetical protein